MSHVDMWEIERSYLEKGIRIICGVDEAGRGPLAGPVCAAAVILPEGLVIDGLDDSKKLSDKRRRELFPIIKASAISYGIAFVDEKEIDQINILQATFLAMERAMGQLTIKPELALIDGNRTKDFGVQTETIVRGDSRCASIAAASVLAKVTRDNYMMEMAQKYPLYGFDVHKGYGTKAHCKAILDYGPCEIHRETFLRKLYGKK